MHRCQPMRRSCATTPRSVLMSGMLPCHDTGTAGRGTAAAPPDDDSAATEVSQGESADEQLRRAVLLFPVAVARLMERLDGQGVGRELEWRAVLGERLFKHASDGGSASLGRLVDIFVERHHQLWKVCVVAIGLRSGWA